MIRLILIMIMISNISFSQQKWTLYVNKSNFEAISDSRLNILEGEVGVMEIGNNRGSRIDEYNDSALGFKKGRGAPYCQSLRTWAWLKSGFIPYPRTALANAPFDYAVRNGKRESYIPEKGDEITWRYPGSWKGHGETVVKILKNGFVVTVAGNVTGSSLSNDPHGGGVKLMRRGIYQKIGRMQMRGLIAFKRQT